MIQCGVHENRPMGVNAWQVEGADWGHERRGMHARWMEAIQKSMQLRAHHEWCSQTDDAGPKLG